MAPEVNSGHGVNPFQEAELKRQEAARQEATELITALSEKTGKRALVIVVDDEEKKRRNIAQFFTEAATKRETGYVLSLKPNGASAIDLYQAVREQESPENPTKVVAVLDGMLGGGGSYRMGDQVAKKLIAISKERGWQPPYLVGASSEFRMNMILKEDYPDQYLSDFSDREVFDEIDAKL
jgi:hypothetical protein